MNRSILTAGLLLLASMSIPQASAIFVPCEDWREPGMEVVCDSEAWRTAWYVIIHYGVANALLVLDEVEERCENSHPRCDDLVGELP